MLKSQIVVIGAGVQGLSVAYNLALGGARSVLVVESEARGGMGSSGRSGSMLMKSRENREKIALSLYSYSRFMNFNEEFGRPLYFRKTGFLSVVAPEMADRYMEEHRLRVEMGAPSILMTPSDVAQVSPGLFTEDLQFGILGPDDGEVQPEQILEAYERRGRELRVSYLFDECAVDVNVERGKVSSVKTNKNTISCELVINAAGANAKQIGGWLDLALPIENRRRSLYIIDAVHPDYNTGPMVEDAASEFYYRPLQEGRLLVGMGLELDQEPTDGPNLEFLSPLRRVASHRTPRLSIDKIVGGTSGIRPITPDILPILGPVSGLEGYLNCCGWGGEGIMHSPASGSMIADLVNRTKTCPLSIQPFLLDRFTNVNSTIG